MGIFVSNKPLGLIAVVTVAGGLGALPSCSSASTADSNLDKAHCEVYSAREGRTMRAEEIDQLDDAVARTMFGSGACVEDVSTAIDRFHAIQPTGCAAGESVVSFVSERAFTTHRPEPYRAVLQRRCSGRAATEDPRVSAILPVLPLKPDVADEIELISESPSRHRQNFYKFANGRWSFMGSTDDIYADGFDCNTDGVCFPKAAAKQSCFTCHDLGGLVMNQYRSWPSNWAAGSQREPAPGVDAIMARRGAQFGTQVSAASLAYAIERSLVQGSTVAPLSRDNIRDAREALAPVFCTMPSLDLHPQVDYDGGPVNFEFRKLVASTFVSTHWAVGSSRSREPGFNPEYAIDVSQADYDELLSRYRSRVEDVNGAPVRGSDGRPVTDVAKPFTVPITSDIWEFTYGRLLRLGIVDQDLLSDVLFVDFTRPTFSKERCGLLQYVPRLTGENMTVEKIRAALIENLQANSGAVEKNFLATLRNPNDGEAHEAAVNRFFQACRSRPRKEMLWDAMQYASHVRNLMRKTRSPAGLSILRGPEALAVDDIPEIGDRKLSPETCKLE